MDLKPCADAAGDHHVLFTTQEPSDHWKCENLKFAKFWHNPENSEIHCEIEPPGEGEDDLAYIRMSQSLFFIFNPALHNGGLPLHAALLELQGKAVAIAAPGHTGKTTCSQRVPAPWKAMADDLCLVVPDQAGAYATHPFPTWSRFFWGQSCDDRWTVERNVPLHAVFFLEQSASDEVVRVGAGEAAAGVACSADQILRIYYRHMNADNARAQRKQVFENACTLVGRVPTYRLRATLTGRFWEEIEAVL